MKDRHPVEALLIDPHPEGVDLFLEALENEKIANRIHAVSTGKEALDFLNQRGEYSNAPRPNLVLLEFDLPEMDGSDLLEQLNGCSALADTPVIVLTGSDEAEDIVESYKLQVNAYLQKPVDPDEFIERVRTLENFWLELVWLPPRDTEDEDENE